VYDDILALKFACPMVIEAGAVPQIAAMLSDIFDIRKEVMLCYAIATYKPHELLQWHDLHGVVLLTIPDIGKLVPKL